MELLIQMFICTLRMTMYDVINFQAHVPWLLCRSCCVGSVTERNIIFIHLTKQKIYRKDDKRLILLINDWYSHIYVSSFVHHMDLVYHCDQIMLNLVVWQETFPSSAFWGCSHQIMSTASASVSSLAPSRYQSGGWKLCNMQFADA